MKSEHNEKGKRERRLDMWVNIIVGVCIVLAPAVVFFVPHKIRGDILVPWIMIVCGIIAYKNRRLSEIRHEERKR